MSFTTGVNGLVAHRFRGRYYTEMTRFESDLDILGMRVVRDIPSDPEKYKSNMHEFLHR